MILSNIGEKISNIKRVNIYADDYCRLNSLFFRQILDCTIEIFNIHSMTELVSNFRKKRKLNRILKTIFSESTSN